MPAIREVVSQFDISTGKSTVIRLMGSDRQDMETQSGNKWDKIIAPNDDSILSVAQVVKGQLTKGRKVYVNVNNHNEGCGVLTIGRLVEQLK